MVVLEVRVWGLLTGYPPPLGCPHIFSQAFLLHVQHSDYFIYYYPYCAMGSLHIFVLFK